MNRYPRSVQFAEQPTFDREFPLSTKPRRLRGFALLAAVSLFAIAATALFCLRCLR
jgi:hypothetical protein